MRINDKGLFETEGSRVPMAIEAESDLYTLLQVMAFEALRDKYPEGFDEATLQREAQRLNGHGHFFSGESVPGQFDGVGRPKISPAGKYQIHVLDLSPALHESSILVPDKPVLQ